VSADDAPAFVRVDVRDDRAALVLFGDPADDRVLVYLPGKCGNAHAPLQAFPRAARAHGTLVVVEGDVPCPGSSRRRWGPDITKIDARVRAAVSAVSDAKRRAQGEATRPLDSFEATVLGYSEGALRAESLAKHFPRRYPSAVILASPRKPSAASFVQTSRVAFAVGDHDAREHMIEGAQETSRAGRTARFFLLPGATHGQYGPEGERVMSEILDFVTRPPVAPASPLASRECVAYAADEPTAGVSAQPSSSISVWENAATVIASAQCSHSGASSRRTSVPRKNRYPPCPAGSPTKRFPHASQT
jgi:predicted esterase